MSGTTIAIIMGLSVPVAFFIVMFNWNQYFKRTTAWERYMRCKDCKKSYPQYGLNASVYTCPYCGKDTTYAVGRYHNGIFEIKDK